MYWYSIWRDVYYTETGSSASSIDYKVHINSVNKDIIGKAYKLPGENDISINVSKIVQPYCETPSLVEEWTGYYPSSGLSAYNFKSSGPAPVATVYTLSGDTWRHRAEYCFVYNYDYEETALYSKDGVHGGPNISATGALQQPITYLYIPGQFWFQSFVSNTWGWKYICNYMGNATPGQARCGRYALIYVNQRGGIDTFAILGSYKKKENITRYSLDRSFNNIDRTQFEKDNYLSTIATSYELNTHYLTDEQSANLCKNLLGSNKVYLQDIERQFVCPVVITDSQVTYQTYQTNGKRLSQYTINVTESQGKIRR